MQILYDSINKYIKKDYDIFYNILNHHDKLKINNLLYKKDKKLCILSRILLYRLLKNDYNIEYNKIKIKYNKFGKPYFPSKNIYFNISHSNEYAIACTSKKRIGIDIEYIRKVDLSIINYFCTYKEKQYILNSLNKYQALFEIFCLKEAYYKMLGTGITNPKSIEFEILNNYISCNKENLNIKLDYAIPKYIIAIIEEK